MHPAKVSVLKHLSRSGCVCVCVCVAFEQSLGGRSDYFAKDPGSEETGRAG